MLPTMAISRHSIQRGNAIAALNFTFYCLSGKVVLKRKSRRYAKALMLFASSMAVATRNARNVGGGDFIAGYTPQRAGAVPSNALSSPGTLLFCIGRTRLPAM